MGRASPTLPRRPGILLFIVALALASTLFGAGALLAYQGYERQRAGVLADAANRAAVSGSRFEQFFEGRFENLTSIALAPIVREGTPAEIKAWFERLVDAGSSFTGGLSLIGTDGIMILLSGFPLDEPPIDLSDRDYVQTVLSTDGPALGDAIIGRRSGDPLLTFAVPVPDEAGETTAVLAGTVRLDLPVGAYATLQVSPDDSVVIDRAGQVVVDRGVVTHPAPADPSFLRAVRDGAGSSEPVVGPDGSGSFVAGYAPIGSSGWRAVVLVDATAAMAPAALGLAFDLATLGLLAVLGILVAIWAGRRLDRAADQEQREADRLRTQEAFLRRFADALPVVAGTLDESLHTTFANEALRARTGSDLVAAIHPDDVSLLPRGTKATGLDRITVDLRLRDDSPDGFRWHRASFLEATDMPGVRWFFAAADIDDEKHAELGLKRDIQQRDEFLGLVSHELRTPMSVIVGNAVRLERRYRERLPDDAIEGLRDIEQSTWQLQRVLENMLVLSKSVAGEAGSDVEPVVLSRLMERTIAEFQVRFPDAVTRTEVDPDLPIVAANETFVDQVLWNLLTNAAKYGARGRPITASARSVGAFVEVAVRDDGPGIPQDELDLIFEPHYRSRSVRARADGLGLGLSVCRRLVELQGGVIAAERLEGSGTRIVFTIPVIETEPVTGVSGAAASTGEPEAAAPHGSPAPAV